MDGIAPANSLLVKLSFGSLLMLGLGFAIFRRMERGFYDYL
jgi:hypothetical protein